MANAVYTKAKQGFLGGDIDIDGGTIKAMLVRISGGVNYVVDLALHDFIDDVPAGTRIGTAATLATKTITDGVFDAADTVFTTPTTGQVVGAIVIYQDTGLEATSRLIAYLDTGTGLPLTTNGADLTVAWSNGADKIVRLA